MKAFLLGLLVSIGILALNGCSKTEPHPITEKSKPLPSWYMIPPAMSDDYLYGAGDGTTLDEARKSALENMIAQLGITIDSSYESTLNVHKDYREYFTKKTSLKIKSEIAKLRISNYETLQSEKRSYNHFIMLVRSDKKQFIQGLVKELDQKIEKTETQRLLLQNSDVISRYRYYQDSSDELNEMFPTLLVLNTLDDSFQDESYLQTISTINAEFQALKEHMTFSLVSDADSTGFMEEIRVALSDRKIRVIEKLRNDNDHIAIALHSVVNYAKSHGFDIARAVLVIEVRDHNGKVVGGNRINLTGHSTQGKAVALESAAKKFRKLIEKDGLASILGVYLN